MSIGTAGMPYGSLFGLSLASAAKADDEALVFSVVKHILDADREDPEFRKVMPKPFESGLLV